MTEIPANTPKPIGRTDNFLPGSWKPSVEDAAAADAETVESAAEVPLGLLLLSEGVPPVASGCVGDVVVAAGVVPVAAAERETVEIPLAIMAPAFPDETPGTADDVPDPVDVACDVVAVTVDPPEGVDVATVVVKDGEAVSDLVAVSVEVDVAVADVRVIVSVEVLAALVAVAVLINVVLDPAAVPPLANASVHFFTSSTAGFPSLSVIGVSVISQVSVTGPAFV